MKQCLRFKNNIIIIVSNIKNLSEYNYIKSRVIGKYGILNFLIKKFFSNKDKYINELSFLNDLKKSIFKLFSLKKDEILNFKNNNQNDIFFDISLPGKNILLGRRNLISIVIDKINLIMKIMGFEIVFGNEIDNELYCFDYLNFPKNHPARDMQDTFYIDNFNILRTHTTSIQARFLEKKKIPLKCVTYGKVYRNETENSNHQSMFYQYELFWVDKNLGIKELFSIINLFLNFIFNYKIKIRFVPKYYPYTNLSFGVQINCVCINIGCVFCNYSGWVTIAGAGKIHDNVLSNFNYKKENVSGIAFGFGIDRLVARLYNISDIKFFYSNDCIIEE